MKTKTLFRVLAVLLLLAVPLIVGSCVLPGTGTIHVFNWLSSDITSLYIYPQGSPDTHDEIWTHLQPNMLHEETGLKPGQWTVHAVIDHGAAEAEETVTVQEGVITVMAIVNSDII